ncbi:MAG: hypothetical protein RID07_09805 [Lacipirellulaceae bacterium]
MEREMATVASDHDYELRVPIKKTGKKTGDAIIKALRRWTERHRDEES